MENEAKSNEEWN